MNSYEFEITSHPSEVLQKNGFYCPQEGESGKENEPAIKPPAGYCKFIDILDERRRQGWDFVQLFFSEKNIHACWKRGKPAMDNT